MKITYLSNSIIPSKKANSIHVMNMCHAYASLGNDVTLICPARKDEMESGIDNIYRHYGIPSTFAIRHLPSPKIRFRSIIYTLSSLLHLILRRPDAAIGRFVYTCVLSVKLGIPTVFDSHGPIWLDGKISALLFRWLIKSKHLVQITTNSAALKQLYLERYPELSKQITALPNGAQKPTPSSLQKTWPGRSNAIQIGYVGSLYAGRGAEVITHCAQQLPEFDFHIVGGDKEDIAQLSAELDCSNLFFHGHKPHHETASYREQCDILLAPYQRSVFNKAGTQDSTTFMCPIKVIEYLSSAKAIVASDLPTIRELLNESQAKLVTPDKMEEWIESIKELAASDTLRARLASSAYQHFENNLTWQARAEKTLHLLNG